MTGVEAGAGARCCWRAVRVLLVGLHSPIMFGDPHSSFLSAKNTENKQAGPTRHRIFYLAHLSANHSHGVLFLHSSPNRMPRHPDTHTAHLTHVVPGP
ncbi:hypothetical protein E2C01_075033 [Portunus trituberculatus]|uniref:Uncharacterized protein n=1 Tax=Portunus trituberculatus TaxID=210409 RepID=A0A5B7IDV7_PORTR|nr:hypothetical protein [Portunus trituberculatus]